MMRMVIVVPSKFTERTNISDLFLEYSENLKKKNPVKSHCCISGFPGDATGKEPIRRCESLEKYWFDPWVRKIP